MALKFDYQSPFGVQMPDCYARVEHVFGSKSGVSASVGIYANSDAAGIGARSVSTVDHAFVPDMAGKNFIAQAYEHLKTLPEYADAVDC
jgi:hypothetical protein